MNIAVTCQRTRLKEILDKVHSLLFNGDIPQCRPAGKRETGGKKKELVTCKAEHKPVCGLCSHMIHDSCQSRNSVSICCWRYFVEFTLFVVQ